MADRKKKRERRKYKSLNINENSFLDEIKYIFQNYVKAIIRWKDEK